MSETTAAKTMPTEAQTERQETLVQVEIDAKPWNQPMLNNPNWPEKVEGVETEIAWNRLGALNEW
jgi:hypothetical protein